MVVEIDDLALFLDPAVPRAFGAVCIFFLVSVAAFRSLVMVLIRWRGSTPMFVRGAQLSGRKLAAFMTDAWTKGQLCLLVGANQMQQLAYFVLGGFLFLVGTAGNLINFPMLAQVLQLWLPSTPFGGMPLLDEIGPLAAAAALLLIFLEIYTAIKISMQLSQGKKIGLQLLFAAGLVLVETIGAACRAYYGDPGQPSTPWDPIHYSVGVAALIGLLVPVGTMVCSEMSWTLFGMPFAASVFHRTQAITVAPVVLWLRLAFGAGDGHFLIEPLVDLKDEAAKLKDGCAAARTRFEGIRDEAADLRSEAEKTARTLENSAHAVQTVAAANRAKELLTDVLGFAEWAEVSLRRAEAGGSEAFQHHLRLLDAEVKLEALNVARRMRRHTACQTALTVNCWSEKVAQRLVELGKEIFQLRHRHEDAARAATFLAEALTKGQHLRHRSQVEVAGMSQLQRLQARGQELREGLEHAQSRNRDASSLHRILVSLNLTPAELDHNLQEAKRLETELQNLVREGTVVQTATDAAAGAVDQALVALARLQAVLDRGGATLAGGHDRQAVDGIERDCEAVRLMHRLGQQSFHQLWRARCPRGLWDWLREVFIRSERPPASAAAATRPDPPQSHRRKSGRTLSIPRITDRQLDGRISRQHRATIVNVGREEEMQ